MSNDIATRLLAVAGAFLKVDPSTLTLDSGPGDVALWDSFAQVGLVAEVEAKFDVAFDGEEVAMFDTLGDIHDALMLRVGTTSAAG